MNKKLFLFGVGNVARWVADQAAHEFTLYGTTRDANKLPILEKAGIRPFLLNAHLSDSDRDQLISLLSGADVLVSFPPDPKNDECLASLCQGANAIVYVSSTGVYGRYHGIVDENTQADFEFESAKPRLAAEEVWRKAGAIIMRAPGLYGGAVGLHQRLKAGTYRFPEAGNNYTSRIHMKDLARIILAALKYPLPKGSIYPVGDLEPATQKEVVSWLCSKMNLPMPESAPLSSVPATLRGNRRVSPKKILGELGIQLEFPTYREGFTDCLIGSEFKCGNAKELAD